MRPVNRQPRPASYTTQIRLDSQANLQADASAISWHFLADSVNIAFGTYDPTAWDVMQGLLLLAKNPKKRGGHIGDVRDAKGTLERKVQNVYHEAAAGLSRYYGQYCNYCDQYLPGQIDVEHCVPKAPYPYFCMSWDNFLFACSACNIAKTNNPPRVDIEQWAQAPYADEVARYDAIRDHYLWPDKDATTYRDMPPALAFFNTNTNKWTKIPDADAVRGSMAILSQDLPTRDIQARLTIGGVARTVRVFATLVGQDAKARESIGYYRLNRTGTDTTSIADARLYNRTLTWFRAVHTFAPLVADLSADRFTTTWPLIIDLATSRGYFSVWVRVLELLNGSNLHVPTGPAPRPTLMERFLTDITQVGGYTNTNLTNVP